MHSPKRYTWSEKFRRYSSVDECRRGRSSGSHHRQKGSKVTREILLGRQLTGAPRHAGWAALTLWLEMENAGRVRRLFKLLTMIYPQSLQQIST